MPRTRLTDNSVLQLTLGVHLALLVLLAAIHRLLRSDGWYSGYELQTYRFVSATCAGVFIAQICLLGLWTAFSRSSPALRMGALVLFAPLLAAVQSQVFNETETFIWWVASREDYLMRYTIWAVELSLFAFAIAMSGWGFRLVGFRLELPVSAAPQENGWQWRLTDLAGLFVVLGLFFAAHNWLREQGWNWRSRVSAAEWALQGSFGSKASFAFLALLLVAGILGFRTSRLGLAVMIVTPLTYSLVDVLLRERGPNLEGMSKEYYIRYIYSVDAVALMYYVFAATFGGTLLVVRDRGYRLRWRRPWSSPPVAESP